MSSDELFTSDEESNDAESSSQDDSSDFDVRTKKRAPRVLESDDEDNEEAERQVEERLTFSPKTRRSINGNFSIHRSRNSSVVAEDTSESESDDSYSESEAESDSLKGKSVVVDETLESVEGEEEELLQSPQTRKSIAGYSRAPDRDLETTEEQSEELHTINYNESEAKLDPDLDNSAEDQLGNVRKSVFDSSIVQKLSSTIMKPSPETPEVEVSDESGSVIEIPDSPDAAVKKVQPTLKGLIEGTQKTSKQLVSRSFYETEVRQVEEIKKRIKTMEGLYIKSAKELPDKGAGLQKSIKSLIEQLKKQVTLVGNMQVDESKNLKNSLQKSLEEDLVVISEEPPKIVPVMEQEGAVGGIDWKEINKANALVQPKFTGKQGLATFGKEKEQVEKNLNNIHGSLVNQPGENDFAETPKSLKVELMDHQKSGLRWLQWREQCRPRGGILADDMGLGKTLSMISLIVARLEDQENGDEGSDSEEEKENSWYSRKRPQRYPGGTLIVCPASLLGQWEGEVTSKVHRGTLQFALHHGHKRETRPKKLAKNDVVVTTYNIASVEHVNQGALFDVKWNRVILDEAHIIRNHKTKISIACSELAAKYRWALTGTPICNKEMDFYAILRFLHVQPYDDLPTYKRWLEGRNGGSVRLHALVKTLMLRRTKAVLQERQQLSLPERQLELVDVQFGPMETNVYQRVLAYSQKLFTQYLQEKSNNEQRGHFDRVHARYNQAQGTEVVQVHQILTVLLRLRQICCHPGLIHQMLEDEDLANTSVSLSEMAEMDVLGQLEKLNLDASGENEHVAKASAVLLNKANPVYDLSRPSSKITRALGFFKEHVLESADKAVFVSQWTTFLDLFEPHLRAMGVRVCKINGNVPVKDRGAIVDSFNSSSPSSPKVMLLSLTAGGVGLNLVGANHLFLLDLHWNPQLENQAQDRIYRVGQKKKIFVYKFMVKGGIEERILALQQQKLQIAHAVMTGAKNIGSKLTMQDLRALFDM